EVAAHMAGGVDVPGDQGGGLPVHAPEPLLVDRQRPAAARGGAGAPAPRRRLADLRALLLAAAQRLEQGALLRGEGREPFADAQTAAPISASRAAASSGDSPSIRASRASRSSGLSSPLARPISFASSAMVGASNSAVTGRSASNRVRIWVTIWIASREWPPS